MNILGLTLLAYLNWGKWFFSGTHPDSGNFSRLISRYNRFWQFSHLDRSERKVAPWIQLQCNWCVSARCFAQACRRNYLSKIAIAPNFAKAFHSYFRMENNEADFRKDLFPRSSGSLELLGAFPRMRCGEGAKLERVFFVRFVGPRWAFILVKVESSENNSFVRCVCGTFIRRQIK